VTDTLPALATRGRSVREGAVPETVAGPLPAGRHAAGGWLRPSRDRQASSRVLL